MKRINLRTIMSIGMLAVSIIALSIIGVKSWEGSKESLENAAFMQLTALRDTRAHQIEDYFSSIRKQVETFSENRMIIEAMQEFNKAFHAVTPAADRDDQLRSFYQTEFFPRLADGSGTTPKLDQYWPTDSLTRTMQQRYLSGNTNQIGEKHLLNRSSEPDDYNRLHEKYHPIIRNYLEKFGYYDIFLVDPEAGHIVYTVFKEIDYGTSLLTGPYKDTNFARVFREARKATEPGFVKLEDFESYDPSYAAPASFIASPIFEGDSLVGVLVFQMPVDEINRVMTSDQNWKEEGLGASGETYLAAKDGMARSISRFLIEDPAGYGAALLASGLPADQIKVITERGNNIGLQPVETKAAKLALAGGTGSIIMPDYRNIPVLSAYRPLAIEDTDWILLAEIDETEAFAPAEAQANNIFIFGLLALAVIMLGAFGLSIFVDRSIVKPLHYLKEEMIKFANGDLNLKIETTRTDEIGELYTAFSTGIQIFKQALTKVTETISHVNMVTQEVSTATEQLSSGIQSQSLQSNELAAAIEEMTQTIASNAQNAIHTSQKAQEGGKLAANGKSVVSETTSYIKNIATTIGESVLTVNKLDKSSEQINLIIGVINDIADQTNLLALNAAIEAARAGELGKGFAVVADEVRKLAERTVQATKEVSATIQNVQSSTHQVVNHMTSCNTRMETGLEMIDSAGDALNNIVSTTNELELSVQQIATASEEQSAVSTGISENITIISNDSRHAAQAIGDIAQHIDGLYQQVKGLQEQTSQFKI